MIGRVFDAEADARGALRRADEIDVARPRERAVERSAYADQVAERRAVVRLHFAFGRSGRRLEPQAILVGNVFVDGWRSRLEVRFAVLHHRDDPRAGREPERVHVEAYVGSARAIAPRRLLRVGRVERDASRKVRHGLENEVERVATRRDGDSEKVPVASLAIDALAEVSPHVEWKR